MLGSTWNGYTRGRVDEWNPIKVLRMQHLKSSRCSFMIKNFWPWLSSSGHDLGMCSTVITGMVMHVFIWHIDSFSTLMLADSLSLKSTSKCRDTTACKASDSIVSSSSVDGEGGSVLSWGDGDCNVAVGIRMEVISDGSIKWEPHFDQSWGCDNPDWHSVVGTPVQVQTLMKHCHIDYVDCVVSNTMTRKRVEKKQSGKRVHY